MDKPVFILNVFPVTCPSCGRALHKQWDDSLNRMDFKAGAAHECPGCHARYQFVSSDIIKEAASKAGGDL